ncbi:MAG: hypothetical protein ACRD3T_04290 [Terriglobia bacterium]
MAKANNAVSSRTIRVTVSVQSEQLLEQLAQKGIYGRNSAEVAGRFVDTALQQFIEQPKLSLESEPGGNRRKR